MFVRNWYIANYYRAFGGNIADQYDTNRYVSSDGCKIQNYEGTYFNPSVFQNNIVPSLTSTGFSSAGTCFLCGTDTEVNFDDYRMTVNLNVIGSIDTSTFSYSLEDNVLTAKIKVKLSNQVGTEQTISSWCVTQRCKYYGLYTSYYEAIMMYKEILDTPITLEASETKYMEIEIKYNLKEG